LDEIGPQHVVMNEPVVAADLAVAVAQRTFRHGRLPLSIFSSASMPALDRIGSAEIVRLPADPAACEELHPLQSRAGSPAVIATSTVSD
jgi:hypothetical protein